MKNIKTFEKYNKKYDIFDAVIDNDIDKIRNFIKDGIDVNIIEAFNGDTPLITAAMYGHINSLNLLLELGADVNIKNYDSVDAIRCSIDNSKIEITKNLLKHGADINTKDRWGRTALISFCEIVYPDDEPNIDMLNFLIENGVDINYFNTNSPQFSALKTSIMYGKFEYSEILLKNGADISLKNLYESPLEYWVNEFWENYEIQELICENQPENVKLLEKYGIDIHPEIMKKYVDVFNMNDIGLF
jgi:ankyrin repeat protein